MAKRVGLWLVGARGNVAATAISGLLLLKRGGISNVGLITESILQEFGPFFAWEDVSLGGHEIRDITLLDEAKKLVNESRTLGDAQFDLIADELAEVDQNILMGTCFGSGAIVESLACSACRELLEVETPRQVVRRLADDLTRFQHENDLERVIVINLSSTEPPTDVDSVPATPKELLATLDDKNSPLRAGSLYAIAAMESGCSFVNFTPCFGCQGEAMAELAVGNGVPIAGCDGKTGETLLKSVLAPMFARRNLEVMSWVGHNIFGNLDSHVLNDPENKATKVASKDQLLTDILGYRPETLVTIERIESLGDWKTAWDHIHFQGFMGVPMSLQFTWQGCDSILAAPLVLDLARLMDLASRRGEMGPVAALASFFKSPIGDTPAEFDTQFFGLLKWLRQ